MNGDNKELNFFKKFKRIFTNYKYEVLLREKENKIVDIEATLDRVLKNQQYYYNKKTEIHAVEFATERENKDNEIRAIIDTKNIEIQQLKNEKTEVKKIYLKLKERELKLEQLLSNLSKNRTLLVGHNQEQIKYCNMLHDEVEEYIEYKNKSDEEIKDMIDKI